MWLVNNPSILKNKGLSPSSDGTDTDSLSVSGYIITSALICSILLLILLISFFINAKKTNKLCWVSRRLKSDRERLKLTSK